MMVVLMIIITIYLFICSSREAGSGGGRQGGGVESGPAPGACDDAVSTTARRARVHSRAEEADEGSGGSRYVALLQQ
jgi:hypothetical protein